MAIYEHGLYYRKEGSTPMSHLATFELYADFTLGKWKRVTKRKIAVLSSNAKCFSIEVSIRAQNRNILAKSVAPALFVLSKLSINYALSETGKDDAKKGEKMEKLQKGEEVDIDLTDPDAQAAATKIQASFRGHKAREDVKKQKDEEAAAVKIQASFRGHQARERVKEIKVSQSKEQVSENVEAVEADTLGKAADAQPEEAVPEEAGGAEESEKQEAGESDQVPDAQPGGAEVAEAQPEPDVAEAEPEPTSEAVKEESAEQDRQEEGEVADEAAGESTEAAGESTEAAEGTEEAGAGVADAQSDGAEGGEVQKVEGEAEEIDLNMNDPELQNAALKIQASFRGHKAREGVKVMKSSESLPQVDNEVASDEKADDVEQDVTEGDEEKGNDDGQESVAEGADAEQLVAEDTEDSKPSED